MVGTTQSPTLAAITAQYVNGSGTGGSGGTSESGRIGTGGTGGSATGGSATGGSATGGSATGGSATGGSATGGSTSDGSDPKGTWRSKKFPVGWAPVKLDGVSDPNAQFLHDFSYAGYHRGEEPPPVGRGTPYRTVDAKFGDGRTDATAAIQKALNDACQYNKGGVVALPEGTFRLTLPQGRTVALSLGCSNLVLRGAGPAKTRLLFDDPTRARGAYVIAVQPAGASFTAANISRKLKADAANGARVVHVESTTGLKVGDWVLVRTDLTDAFRTEHGMTGTLWPISSSFKGLIYPRRVVRITGDAVEFDIPIRYTIKTRDAARITVTQNLGSEIGLESFSIGMVQNNTTWAPNQGEREDDYKIEGTTGYQVNSSRAVDLRNVHDSWVFDVDTFQPSQNQSSGAHVLSQGFNIADSVFRVTVQNCEIGRPQYRGGGGNGYAISINGHDCLLADNRTTSARHGFIYTRAATGNVILRGTTVNSRYADDTHAWLSQANLYDSMTLDGGFLQSVNRGTTSGGAGFTGTELVYWNTFVKKNHSSAQGCAVETAQWGWGYAIGSRAATGAQAKLCPKSFSNSTWAKLNPGAPTDYVEGEGLGATLYPQSLYTEQLRLRCKRENLNCR
jgi:hypothetical protein